MESTGQDRRPSGSAVNVGEWERLASGVGGIALAVMGLSGRGLERVVLPLVGGALAYRGLSGHCPVYGQLGLDTSGRGEATAVPAGHGFKVERSIKVNKGRDEVFRFWRRLDQLPRFMSHLLTVIDLGDGKSHWVAKAPLGIQVAWDAEIINEKIGEMIAWRSLPGSMVETAGSVHFEKAGRGTEVKVSLKYNPPAGQAGAALARWLGESPETQIEEDLERFKRLVENERVPMSQHRN